MAPSWLNVLVVFMTLVGTGWGSDRAPTATDRGTPATRPALALPVPVPFVWNRTDDVDVEAHLHQAEADALMACEFLKSIIEDMVASRTFLSSMVPGTLLRRRPYVAEAIGAQVLMFWINVHSVMASMHSWIASVDPHSPDDVFDVGQAMYRLVRSAQAEVIHAAVAETPFSDVLKIEGGVLKFTGEVLHRQDQDVHSMTVDSMLADGVAMSIMPAEFIQVMTLARSDPTEVSRIERVIEAVRVVQLRETLCDDLYLRFEALASYVTVFRSLLPLIRTNPRYASINAYEERNLNREIRKNKLSSTFRRNGDAVHRIQIGLTKSAITKVFGLSVNDLTTPLFPRSEPRQRIVQKKKKSKSKRNRRNRKRKQDMSESDVDIAEDVQDVLETKLSSPIAQHGDVEIRTGPSSPPPAATIGSKAIASRAESQCITTMKSTNGNLGTNRASTRPASPAIHHELLESKMDPLLALQSKNANIPSRMSDFVEKMSTMFNVKESKTKNSLTFFDKQTGVPVFGMHRPHGGKKEHIRDDILSRIRSKLRRHFEASSPAPHDLSPN